MFKEIKKFSVPNATGPRNSYFCADILYLTFMCYYSTILLLSQPINYFFMFCPDIKIHHPTN